MSICPDAFTTECNRFSKSKVQACDQKESQLKTDLKYSRVSKVILETGQNLTSDKQPIFLPKQNVVIC